MAAATPTPAANLGQVVEDLLPEILVAYAYRSTGAAIEAIKTKSITYVSRSLFF
ncbi:MAG TPA: hypothetical protein VNS63_05590 [Blastocatellia bacterium]|nr:hypothetical protein [Blastocatellia bacterium]